MKGDGIEINMHKNQLFKEYKKWIKWMNWGRYIGCHQKPERSFFYKGYQFPVCARCTGVLLSSIMACGIFFIHPLKIQYCLLFCFIMFLDWLLQSCKIKESTNIRCLIIGFIGGYGFMTLQMYVYSYLIRWACISIKSLY